ncbi:MAG: metallophosphoesterase, partial [Candidatus Aminicenantes bacterium]|nr:metallophosphoesterase [Candidatus Aminicenantes bacterium]
GDLVEDGWNPAHWEIFNEIIAPLLVIADFYPALGNHEANSPLYFENFSLPGNERWYTVDIQDIHFVILDSNIPIGVESEQYQWLKNELIKMADLDVFLIVVFHHPPFSSGPHAEDEMGLRQTIVPLLETYGVDIVFNGHDHFYERSRVNTIYYVVTGGGGAPLHDKKKENPYSQVFYKKYHFCRLSVKDNQLIVDVYTKNLSKIDHFYIKK